uniref:WAP domain-containing protein n=1 Tax=Alexandrium monilatum TaxID=311494 RepID=A0A7S4V8B1_9DINO
MAQGVRNSITFRLGEGIPMAVDAQLEEYRQRQHRRHAAAASGGNQKGTPFSWVTIVRMLLVGAVFVQPVPASASATGDIQGEEAGEMPLKGKPVEGLDPVREQDPKCPKVEKGIVGTCVEECSRNADCKSGLLCCSNGCGHICVKPGATKGGPKASALMVVLDSKDSADSLLEAVPTPDQKSLLSGAGIMILHYDKDHSVQACKAHSILSGHPGAKAVEWDGPAPACKLEL